MTELTLFDVLFLVFFFLFGIGLAGWGIEMLDRGDKRRNRGSQCPPHDWVETYQDKTDGGSERAGLRCAKCKRRPNGLPGGESWLNPFQGE